MKIVICITLFPRIINNSIYKKDNFIVINKGKIDGVKKWNGNNNKQWDYFSIINSTSDNYSK